MKVIRSTYLFILLLLAFFHANGQVISSAELKLMRVLNSQTQGLPKNLLKTKTIVIISLGEDQKTGLRGDWKSVAEEAHFYISRLGIDPVLYIYIDDLIAGYDVQRAIAVQMLRREIVNLLFLSKDKVDGRDQYIGVLTTFNKKPDFVSHNQPAWKSQTSDLEILFRNLNRTIDKLDLEKENFLIIDMPEFFRGIDIIKGKRFETFNTDLRIDRLAVPEFEELPLPDNGQNASTEIVNSIKGENAKNLENNSFMEQFMAKYPYKFNIVPYEYDEKKLLAKGFQFVLMRIQTSGENVRKLLDYDISEEIEELITVKKSDDGSVTVKSIPVKSTVYKYYIKHINSGDIYLGKQWDGDDNWKDAFTNHMNALIGALRKN